ncbi:MAG: SDR family oxidoreductase [Candidatus Omnitrophica bacterium]|nr:SDR family oxidoreductase [Candidatus Omnitrophota bacterium]
MCDELFELKDKVVVITGGGGVLCSTIAKALAQRGAKVAILDLNEKAAKDVAQEISKNQGEAIGIKADVLKKDSLEKSLEFVLSKFKKVDILINGAGGNKKEATTSDELDFFNLSADAVRWVFDLNFLGTFLPSQVFGKELVKQGKGIILNISSMNALRPLTRIPAYSAAKAAVSNFTLWLAVHISQNYSKNIRVNAVAPGFFLTEQNRFLLMDEKTKKFTPRGQTIIGHTPMERFGEPLELIGTVTWLLSDASAFVHGVVIPVDGGFSAFSGV